METSPSTVAQLLKDAIEVRQVSRRAAAMYMGVTHAALYHWMAGEQVPNPESCAKIAAWAGYPLDYILRLAGHIPPNADIAVPTPLVPPPPEVEIIPELGLLVRRFSPEQQRRYLVPAARFALSMAEERAPFNPPPHTPDPEDER